MQKKFRLPNKLGFARKCLTKSPIFLLAYGLRLTQLAMNWPHICVTGVIWQGVHIAPYESPWFVRLVKDH
ncbi:MAG: hypothetical protein CML57_08840 [Rhodobacteraceae bacterium]|nr:hypothetical protein [Paracoccaceae bacterium]HCJ61885.1 hypothetical protein [Alphaproteobacteria bacterium]